MTENLPYREYIISPSSIGCSYQQSGVEHVKYLDSDFTKPFFKKLSAHFVKLYPGCRTSLPHAESHEEEFVFVVSGKPHAWIDGFIYELSPHQAVGFPAGTGIAHSFINNTSEVVEFLIFGERTKPENKCSFPLDPSQKTRNIYWRDAPQRSLGPHSGLPGPVRQNEFGSKLPTCIVDCTNLPVNSGWHYPNHTETFGDYVRLTDHLNLSVMGIGYESLEPGKRSAFPHSHSVEEEFVLILSGQPKVWINGYLHETNPCDGIVFVPGTNFAHCIVNDSNEKVRYMVLGEAKPKGDKVYYPGIDFRNQQCKEKGNLWEDRPSVKHFGSHKASAQ